MLLTAFGAATPFGHFGAKIMEALINVCCEKGLFLPVNRAEELYAPLSGKSLQGIALFLTTPEHALVTVARRLNPKCVVFYETPEALFRHVMAQTGNNAVESFRATSRHIACQSVALASGDAFVVRNNPKLDCGQLISALCLHFGLRPDPETLARALESQGITGGPLGGLIEPPPPTPEPAPGEQALATPGVMPEHLAMLQELVPALDEIAPAGLLRDLNWRPGHFFTQSRVNYAVSESTGDWEELLGAARYLYFGPYFHLAPGQWTVRAAFRVRGNISGNKLEFDVVQEGERLAFGRFDLPVSGIFEVETSVYHAHPERSIEFRLKIQEGAIDGELVLDRVIWQHVSFAPPPEDGALAAQS